MQTKINEKSNTNKMLNVRYVFFFFTGTSVLDRKYKSPPSKPNLEKIDTIKRILVTKINSP
jgi:hypothetical protein